MASQSSLTRSELRLYLALLEEGSLNAKTLAQKTNDVVPAVYRTMRALKQKGFVIFLDTFPQKFQAVPPPAAIASYVQRQKQSLDEILEHASVPFSKQPPTNIDLVMGRIEMYNAFVTLSHSAKKEILVISIGEQVPDEVKLAHRDAQERGVMQKLLFHKFDKQNEEIARTWVKMDIEVRHFSDWGFHLMVFDGKRSILVANNPKETAERIGMVIYSEGLSKALRDYFYSVWKKATPIN